MTINKISTCGFRNFNLNYDFVFNHNKYSLRDELKNEFYRRSYIALYSTKTKFSIRRLIYIVQRLRILYNMIQVCSRGHIILYPQNGLTDNITFHNVSRATLPEKHHIKWHRLKQPFHWLLRLGIFARCCPEIFARC